MSITYDGVELDSTLLTISGTIVLDEDQAAIVGLGGTVSITLRGRVKGKNAQVGGQNTKPRLVASVAFDALDELTSAEAIKGQMKIGEEPAPAPSDAD